jgi:hypothetical protein
MNTQLIGQKVKVYRNLNNGKIAVRDMKDKVIAYCDSILLKDCTTKTSEKTVARIQRILKDEGKQARDVHAFIIGEIVTIDEGIDLDIGRRVSYNPFKGSNFYYCDDASTYSGSSFVQAQSAPKGQPMITLAF